MQSSLRLIISSAYFPRRCKRHLDEFSDQPILLINNYGILIYLHFILLSMCISNASYIGSVLTPIYIHSLLKSQCIHCLPNVTQVKCAKHVRDDRFPQREDVGITDS